MFIRKINIPIRNKIIIGETFDKILENYSINTNEIKNIKNKLSKKINLNRLNTSQKIYLTIDQSNNSVKEVEKIEEPEMMVLREEISAGSRSPLKNTSFKNKKVYKHNVSVKVRR